MRDIKYHGRIGTSGIRRAIMRELTQDPFYELIGKEYDRCVIDYTA